MATMTVNDIVMGLNQAAANAYDGSHDKRFVVDGEDKPIGLKREDGCAINDSRVVDGFKVRFSGPKFIVTYQSELPLKDVHNTKLDQEIEQTYADIIKYIKKEFKKITGNAVTLKADGPCDILMQNMSRIRTWVQCQKTYTIGNMKDVTPILEPSEDRLEKDFKAFLNLKSNKKPKNVTRKSD
jgi:hypothetical protein